MKGIVWKDEALGAEFVVGEIPGRPEGAGRRVPPQAGRDWRSSMDDAALEAYLEGKEPDVETLKRCIRKGTIAGAFVPVLCGSAFKNKGVQPMLDAVVDYLPSPIDVPAVIGHRSRTARTQIDAARARTTSRSPASPSRS